MFKRWPLLQKLWFFTILGGFWISGAVFAYKHGNRAHFHTDETTEQMSIFAANHFYEHGFLENYLLPTYPPFGHAPDGSMRDKPFVYNHYLGGPDLVLGVWLKIFGKEALWSGRLIPHTLTMVAMGVLAFQFAVFMGSSLMGCILLGLLMVPRSLTAWSIALYGHSYVMAYYLYLFAGMLWLINRQERAGQKISKGLGRHAWALGFVIGLLQMFFDLDWLPVTFLSATSFALLFTRMNWQLSRRVLLGMVLGGTFGVVYQLTMSSLYFGSLTWVIENTIQWMKFRTGAEHVAGVTMGDMRLSRILQEYNRQAYGATGFTALNLVALSATFLVLGFLGKVKSKVQALRGLEALACAYLGAIFWNVVMRQHSAAHTHFLPRHYFALYLHFMFMALPIAYQLVLRSRKVSAPASC